MAIELKRLTEVKPVDLINLMNNPLVLKYMPLFNTQKFDETAYAQFMEEKENIWKENGYGPWAFFQDEVFVGWGGLQPVEDDVELAMVLHPSHWGLGIKLTRLTINYAFQTLKLPSIIILFPPERPHVKGILRLGFKREKEMVVDGALFVCYRLMR